MTTILIIDDTPTNITLLLKHLQLARFRVLVAENGEVGLERAAYIKPDLILLDVMMPGLNGFEACRLLKINPETQHIPVVFMTALNDTVDKMRGFEVGGVDYITKPFEAQEVLARITTHLTLYRLQNDLEGMVQARTADLEAEIERRKKTEVEKDELLNIVRSQSEQLHHLINQPSQTVGHAVEPNEAEELTLNLSALDSSLTQLLLNLQDIRGTHPVRSQLKDSLSLIKQTRQSLSDTDQDIAPIPTSTDPRITLPPRELEVLHFVAKGYSNRDIAAKLHLSPGTVSTYRARLMRRLEAKSVTDLIKIAMNYNLLES